MPCMRDVDPAAPSRQCGTHETSTTQGVGFGRCLQLSACLLRSLSSAAAIDAASSRRSRPSRQRRKVGRRRRLNRAVARAASSKSVHPLVSPSTPANCSGSHPFPALAKPAGTGCATLTSPMRCAAAASSHFMCDVSWRQPGRARARVRGARFVHGYRRKTLGQGAHRCVPGWVGPFLPTGLPWAAHCHVGSRGCHVPP